MRDQVRREYATCTKQQIQLNTSMFEIQDDLEEELVTAALLPQLEFLRARQGEILLAVLAILLTCGALYLAPR